MCATTARCMCFQLKTTIVFTFPWNGTSFVVLHHQHGRDGREALGPGTPRLGETEARWTGPIHRRRGQAKSHDLDGGDHDRHHPAHCGGRHEASGAGPSRSREDLLQLQREPLVHRKHVPGADRLAWRLGAKTRIPALGASVGLCLCPSKGFPAGMDPYCSSGVPRDLHSGWLHCGAAARRHLDPAAPETQHRRAGHAVFCRVRVPGRCASAPCSVSWRSG